MSDAKTQKAYEFADFRLIPAEGLLLQNGQPVPLSPKVFETLLFLIERRGHLVLKSELLENVWTDAFVEENAASKSIWSIRNALQEDSKSPQFIQTVPTRGYRFVGDVKEVFTESTGLSGSDAMSPSEAAATAAAKRPILWLGWATGIAALGIIAVVMLLSAGFGGWLRTSGEAASIRSLTVLPLENASGDEAVEYLVDGVTNTLIADLARIGELHVISLPAELRGPEHRDPNDVRTQLDVDAVLFGSVALSGDRVRIAMQLLHAKSGRILWAKDYERDKNDIQSLQKEVARNVASEIRALSPEDLERFRISRRADPQAYHHYLRGQYYANRQNPKDQDIAIAEFERAVEIDPAFAAALADLAQAYTWKHFSFSPDQPELAEKAFIASAKAMALDPNLPMAYLARGRLRWTPENNFPHQEAAQDYRKALELDSRLDEALNQLAMVYTHVGALDEALRESRLGVEINPNNNLLKLRIGQTLNSQTKYADALAVLRDIPKEVHPSVVGHQTAWALLNLGRIDEASAKIDQLMKDHPDKGGTFASVKAVLAGRAGDHQQAEEWIKVALEKGKGFGHFHHTAYTIGCAYALMNKPDEAIRYLEMAAETGFPCYPSYEKDPNLNSLRQNPRFVAFMERLERQWKENLSKVVIN